MHPTAIKRTLRRFRIPPDRLQTAKPASLDTRTWTNVQTPYRSNVQTPRTAPQPPNQARKPPRPPAQSGSELHCREGVAGELRLPMGLTSYGLAVDPPTTSHGWPTDRPIGAFGGHLIRRNARVRGGLLGDVEPASFSRSTIRSQGDDPSVGDCAASHGDSVRPRTDEHPDRAVDRAPVVPGGERPAAGHYLLRDTLGAGRSWTRGTDGTACVDS